MTPPLPTRSRVVAEAIGPMSTSGLGPASEGPPWCSAHPVAVVAEIVRQAGEVDRIAQRLRAGRALGDRGLIENGDAQQFGHATDASNCRLAVRRMRSVQRFQTWSFRRVRAPTRG